MCSAKTGIAELLKGAKLDETMFYPCGYSLNGVDDNVYYTIHVTPQPECSYASFETNKSFDNYEDVISKLVDVFRPTRFIVNLCSAGVAGGINVGEVSGFHRRDMVEYNFGRYTMQVC